MYLLNNVFSITTITTTKRICSFKKIAFHIHFLTPLYPIKLNSNSTRTSRPSIFLINKAVHLRHHHLMHLISAVLLSYAGMISSMFSPHINRKCIYVFVSRTPLLSIIVKLCLFVSLKWNWPYKLQVSRHRSRLLTGSLSTKPAKCGVNTTDERTKIVR